MGVVPETMGSFAYWDSQYPPSYDGLSFSDQPSHCPSPPNSSEPLLMSSFGLSRPSIVTMLVHNLLFESCCLSSDDL
jgi:hypothetical protein